MPTHWTQVERCRADAVTHGKDFFGLASDIDLGGGTGCYCGFSPNATISSWYGPELLCQEDGQTGYLGRKNSAREFFFQKNLPKFSSGIPNGPNGLRSGGPMISDIEFEHNSE
jgi:hypothetical protein